MVRPTTDVDALLFTKPGRLAKLERLFERAGFDTELRTAEADDPISGMFVLSDDRNETLRIVGREDFIAIKCFAGSPQDLLDARSAYRATLTRV